MSSEFTLLNTITTPNPKSHGKIRARKTGEYHPLQIYDDYLDSDDFDKIAQVIMGNNIPWYYNTGVVEPNEKTFQFCHEVYNEHCPRSDVYGNIFPLLNRINPAAIDRIKINCQPRTDTIHVNKMHVDAYDKRTYSGILYINDNDGYTEFEDGQIVQSKANRFITWPSYIRHRGTTCTDQHTRVLINLVYYPKEI